MSTRNPAKDQVAIVGVGTSAYSRDSGRSPTALALDAARQAIGDAGLTAADIDGIYGTDVPHPRMAAALGLPATTWFGNHQRPFTFQVVAAINAVFAGACDVALVYHSVYRGPARSRAAGEALRMRTASQMAGSGAGAPPALDSIAGAGAYAAWASRYLHEYDVRREHLGLVAINSRSNALMNDHAVMKKPITMDDYLAARMIREPLGMLDMDLPIDGADALVITTRERARDLARTPVLVHAAAMGQTGHPQEDQTIDFQHTGQNVVMDTLWRKSDVELGDIDVVFPYDGFTILALSWLENIGYCKPGEAGPFLESNWDPTEQRIKIDGRVLVNTHGGSLSEGATQGAGHIREAVVQLRGEAGERQADAAKAALVTPGGFFFNAGALLLRTGDERAA